MPLGAHRTASVGCADMRRGEGSAADSSSHHRLGYKNWDFGPIASLTLQLSPRCRRSWPSSATSAAPRPLPPLCPGRAAQGSAVPLPPAGQDGRSSGERQGGGGGWMCAGERTRSQRLRGAGRGRGRGWFHYLVGAEDRVHAAKHLFGVFSLGVPADHHLSRDSTDGTGSVPVGSGGPTAQPDRGGRPSSPGPTCLRVWWKTAVARAISGRANGIFCSLSEKAAKICPAFSTHSAWPE